MAMCCVTLLIACPTERRFFDTVVSLPTISSMHNLQLSTLTFLLPGFALLSGTLNFSQMAFNPVIYHLFISPGALDLGFVHRLQISINAMSPLLFS